MAKVLLEPGIQFRVASNATVLGAAGNEVVTVLDGATINLDANINKVVFSGTSTDYTFKSTTTGMQVIKAGVAIANLGNGTTLVFADGSALASTGFDFSTLSVTVHLGDALVTDTASVLTPTLTTNESLDTSNPTANAKVILEGTETFTAASNAIILGATGNQTVKVQDGAVVSADTNVERVEFTGATSDYTYKSIPTGLQVSKAGVAIANVGNGSKLAFNDGSAVVSTGFDVSTAQVTVHLGDTLVTDTDSPIVTNGFDTNDTSNNSDSTPTAEPTAAPTTATIDVSATNTSYDASTLANTFNFNSAEYTYTISGFGRGDVLNLPDTNLATIVNNSGSDGNITVQWADSGSLVQVILAGVSIANDSAIWDVASFNAIFGTGAII